MTSLPTDNTLLCPCDLGQDSALRYVACCGQYHSGPTHAPDALALMRSRYTAVALGGPFPKLADYLVQTVHRSSRHYDANLARHRAFWVNYCQQTRAMGLTIVDYQLGDIEAMVHFRAALEQGGKPLTLEERSRFTRLNKRWLYVDGEWL